MLTFIYLWWLISVSARSDRAGLVWTRHYVYTIGVSVASCRVNPSTLRGACRPSAQQAEMETDDGSKFVVTSTDAELLRLGSRGLNCLPASDDSRLWNAKLSLGCFFAKFCFCFTFGDKTQCPRTQFNRYLEWSDVGKFVIRKGI